MPLKISAAILLSLTFLCHCSFRLPSPQSTLTIKFPPRLAGPAVSAMKCFFASVKGAGITNATLANISGCSSLSLGITSSLVTASNQEMRISEVPVGPSRTIEIYGVVPPNEANCPAGSTNAATLLFSSTSQINDIYLIGTTTANITSDARVTVSSSYNADTTTSRTGQCMGGMVLALGSGYSCVFVSGQRPKCWGYNFRGQLGLDDDSNRGNEADEMGSNLPRINLGTGRTATKMTAGDDHTCAILDNARLKCWGRNTTGQLGLGDQDERGDGHGPQYAMDVLDYVDLGTGRTATQVSAGGLTCAILDNGTVKCWGRNDLGQLGLEDTSNRGTSFGQMGDNLPTVNLGTGRTATRITSGSVHSCALLDNGNLKCWGDNGYGQLGLGDQAPRGDAPGEMGDNLPAIDLGTGRTATQISIGGEYTCALLDNGTVKCWGENLSGQLGLGDISSRGEGPGEMGDNLPAIDLGTGRTATQIASGSGHSCALLDNGSIKCWGANGSGSLGLGDTDARGDAPGEMGDNLPTVNLGTGRIATQIRAGGGHTCAVLDNGSIKCWGSNSYGELGLGDALTRGDGPGEMGDNLPVVELDL